MKLTLTKPSIETNNDACLMELTEVYRFKNGVVVVTVQATGTQELRVLLSGGKVQVFNTRDIS
jgi:hypothetical protein